MQNYLKSNNNLTDEEKCLLFRFRVREINVKCNYKNKYLDLKCDFCKNYFDDNQYHLLQYEYFIDKCKNLANNIQIEYEVIFEDNEKQIKAAKLLQEVWKTREALSP